MYQRPYLLLRTTQGNRYLPLVGKNCWTIGRSNDNDFVLNDHWVSRNHAMLQQTDAGDYFLIDLGSRNGTFVNGRRVTFPIHLRHLDQISFGLTRIELHSTVNAQENEETELNHQETWDTDRYERCLVSVLIANVHDFTSLARLTEEHTISRLMGDWLRESNIILRRSNCTVTKYISDMIVGVWLHQDAFVFEQVVQILKAASDFIQTTKQLTEKYDLTYPLKMGIGISGGYATLNKISGDDPLQYNVLGSPVNTAIRLQQVTRKLMADIVLGDETYQVLSPVNAAVLTFRKHEVSLKDYPSLSTVYATNYNQLREFLDEALVSQESPS